MIHITYKTEHYDTKINIVEFHEECLEEDDWDENKWDWDDNRWNKDDNKWDSDKETSYCESHDGKSFFINEKSDRIYLLVSTIDDCCCCMSGSTEQVTNVSNDFNKIIDVLMKHTNKTPQYDSKYYDIRTYILSNDTQYIYDQTHTINRTKYECEDTNYIFIWLYNGDKNIPFPDETQEHFDNKLKEHEFTRSKSKEYRIKLDELYSKITDELSEQITHEKQIKKDLLQKLNNICNLEEIKYRYVYELDDAVTITQKILNTRIAEIKSRNEQKCIEFK